MINSISINAQSWRKNALSCLNWLVPSRCIHCQQSNAEEHHPCCTSCYEQLPFQPHCCAQCGQTYTVDSDVCGRCLAKPPAFDACFCPFQYEEPIAGQIRDFKYHGRPELARPLAQLLATELNSNVIERPDLIIPVPLHLSRLRERGYNQSLLLAKALSKHLGIPVNNRVIEKHKATPAQAHLSLKQRNNNLKGCFKLHEPVDVKSVAILDDVVTTGATATEIVKILKKSGIDYVQVWGLAHTL